MKMQDIQELSEKERGEKLSDLREEYFNLKFQIDRKSTRLNSSH